jgi:rhodanese-related sulfurtransferase
MSTPLPSNSGLDARGLPRGYAFKPEWEITPRETKQMLDTATPDSFILLDCRRPEEWQATRIKGARHIPMADIERRAEELETDTGTRDTPIVVHCHHGMRSPKVTGALRAMGFTNVRSMAGGIDLWSVDVDPGVARY